MQDIQQEINKTWNGWKKYNRIFSWNYGGYCKWSIFNVKVSAKGYVPYEQEFEIIGGSTTQLRAQLMVERNESGNISNHKCAGVISEVHHLIWIDIW